MRSVKQTAPECTKRIVLLGASNVARSISTILSIAHTLHTGPLEVLGAFGHGRSYGKASRVLHRQLPGIEECGLWETLKSHPRLPTFTLLTDVGNDLLYLESVDRIANWVDACLDRVARHEGKLIVTRLPISNLDGLSARRFSIFRKLFFPGCPLDQNAVAERARALDLRVAEIAKNYGATVIEPRKSWYGIDPIHITFRQMNLAWNEILNGWSNGETNGHESRRRIRGAPNFFSYFPERQRLFGIERRTQQPARRIAGGSQLWLY